MGVIGSGHSRPPASDAPRVECPPPHRARLAPYLPWLAHAYTALGAVIALQATLAVVAGAFPAAFLWLSAAVVVDATDGWLARALDVKRRLPGYDGARLDDIVDYLTYVFVPALLVHEAGLVPPGWLVPVAAAMLLSSAYGFGQTTAKVVTTDHFFTGFPSYWNIVVLYLYVWGLGPAVNAAVLLTCAVLVFVPLRYVYPSRTVRFRALTLVLGLAWGLLLLAVLLRLPRIDAPMRWLLLGFPAYYLALSAYLHLTTPTPPRPHDQPRQGTADRASVS